MRNKITSFLKFAAFLGLGFGILYYVYAQQQSAYAAECALKGIAAEDCSLVQKVLKDFAGANFGWLAVVLGCFTLSNVSRALRWNMLLEQLGPYQPRFINAFLTINLGYFANLGLPRVGEVVKAGTMARYEKISIESVIGTIVVDRVIDVICILSLTALSLYLGYDKLWGWISENAVLGDKLANIQHLLIGLVLVGITGLGALWLARERLMQYAFFNKVFVIFSGFADGLRTVGKLNRPWIFLLHTLNIWGMYYLMTYLCLFAFAPTEHLGMVAALITFIAGGWGIVVPSPGGMGSYHFMTQAALTLYGVAGDDAFSWSNIAFFTINLGCNVVIGLLALLLLPRINAGYEPVGTSST